MTDEMLFQPPPLERGVFLIASPRLVDPNFMRTVVLLCAHGPEGSFGLIVNRPGQLTMSDVSSDSALLAGREDRLWVGGPVQVETLQILHRLGPGIPGSMCVLEDVHLGGDATVLRDQLEHDEEGRDLVRFMLGYSGWGEGQLEAELEEGGWIVCPADPALVFDPRPATVWRRAMRALGGTFAELADEPPDPSWN